MCKDGADAPAWGGQPFHEGEGGLRQGQVAREVLVGVERGCKPGAKPPYYLCRVESQASKGNWGLRSGRVSLAGGAPVDEFCFGNREFDV